MGYRRRYRNMNSYGYRRFSYGPRLPELAYLLAVQRLGSQIVQAHNARMNQLYPHLRFYYLIP